MVPHSAVLVQHYCRSCHNFFKNSLEFHFSCTTILNDIWVWVTQKFSVCSHLTTTLYRVTAVITCLSRACNCYRFLSGPPAMFDLSVTNSWHLQWSISNNQQFHDWLSEFCYLNINCHGACFSTQCSIIPYRIQRIGNWSLFLLQA
jgi:hypothetical protein